MQAPAHPTREAPCLYLLRFSGELGTKARATRSQFTSRLVRNLRDALAGAGLAGRVRRRYERLMVESAAPAEEALARVFGLQSLSRVLMRPGEKLAEVVEAGRELYAEAVRARRFAVRARRVGDRQRIDFGARDVERELGRVLLPLAARVDLERPEVTVHVELYEGSAYFFSERLPGPGGLPLGSSGRAVALVSGGFDSAVAAWQMQRRGLALDYVFCNLGGSAHRLGALRVTKRLVERWSAGTRPQLVSLDFEPVAAQLRERTEPRLWQVLLKRLMLHAAQAVARERRAGAIVTGEALGQVSSQTLANLTVISQAAQLPILRPLLGANKDEIIGLARRIGTAELSAVVQEYCAMVPHRPATAADLEAVLAEEAKLEPELLEGVLATREVFDLHRLDPEAGGIPDLEVTELPEGATVIDLRSRAAWRAWHAPGAIQLDLARALAALRSFERDRTYVVYCEFGLKSAHLAERMRAAGLRAFHVRGGVKRLLGAAARAELALAAPVAPAEA